MAILAGVEKAKFRRPVVPGDQLQIEVRFGRFKRSMGKASGIIRVNQEVVSEAELIFALLEVSP
jgi:3-hydroxyacyl-[acyl-carrier-protein] dehydratase